MLLAEYELSSWGRATTATKLIDIGKYDTSDAITAAGECGDLERAKQFLEKQCEVCLTEFPMNKVNRHCIIDEYPLFSRQNNDSTIGILGIKSKRRNEPIEKHRFCAQYSDFFVF